MDMGLSTPFAQFDDVYVIPFIDGFDGYIVLHPHLSIFIVDKSLIIQYSISIHIPSIKIN